MEALYINNNFTSGLSLKEVIATFFKGNSPETVHALFWKMFQCWVIKDCNVKAEVSDEEVALLFDQLNDLVAEAYKLHQANADVPNQQEGISHD
ncbi:hypothetical protein [Mucilaginibacter sp. UYCu711]|uniref:hypothetical protein n=1 Tax=Mucilaginibacter sp. UYCu711 TaxID=3156339 RepID=UPI003D21F636